MAAPVAAGGLGSALLQGLGGLGREVAAEGIVGGIQAGIGGLSSAARPSSYESADPNQPKPYFQGAAPDIAYRQWYANEVFKIQSINNILKNFGVELPLPASPESFISGVEERVERQAESLGARERKLESLKRQYEYLNALMEAQSAVKKQELSSLGEIQRTRVGSSYDMAGRVLDTALKEILTQDRLENSSTLSALASPT